jgi:hypothetical protein
MTPCSPGVYFNERTINFDLGNLLAAALLYPIAAALSVRGCGGGECDICILVRVSHLCSFSVPICPLVLENAKTVNPNILNVKLLTEIDCIFERLWQIVSRNVLLVRQVVGSGRHDSDVISPTMTQSCV